MLNKLIFQESGRQIINKIKSQKNRTLQLLDSYIKGKYTGWEYKSPMPHPLIFELGHISLFYDYHFIRNTQSNMVNPFENTSLMFDSLINKPEERIHSNIIPFDLQLLYYNEVMDNIMKYFKENKTYSPYETYLINLSLLHNTMHDEVLLFLQHMLHQPNPLFMNENTHTQLSSRITQKIKTQRSYTNKLKFIPGGSFKQGSTIQDRNVVWDNERKQHIQKVNPFYCYEYPVNNYEYLQFINNNGYNTEKYWSFEGWKWRCRENATRPFYWFKTGYKWYRKHFHQLLPLNLSEPVVHINYYEAEAYANYIGGRLPTETEYEYLLTNGGTTKYPWGMTNDMEYRSNVNYKYGNVIPLHIESLNNENLFGIKHLFGNCWYWTSTRFYPYNGYTIDPIYNTFSYPFFYDRYVVKGAAWSCGRELVYPQYRNSQEPYKQFHFTGIRVVCDDV
jgi:iron(II)-dependent oxidoreductase